MDSVPWLAGLVASITCCAICCKKPEWSVTSKTPTTSRRTVATMPYPNPHLRVHTPSDSPPTPPYRATTSDYTSPARHMRPRSLWASYPHGDENDFGSLDKAPA